MTVVEGSAPEILAGLAPPDVVFVGGGIAGSIVLGLYLFVSLRIFGRHSNEAFSSLKIQDFKQWVRLRIDAAGELTILAIAIDRVPRRWSEHRSGGRGRIQPDDRAATAPRLIEMLTLRPRGEDRYAVHGIDERGRRYSREAQSR